MWRNHLTIALRLFVQNRAYAAINIGGLALGLAGCLLILNYIRYERSYDAWLPDSVRVHQVQATWAEPGQPVTRSQSSPFPTRDALPGGFPQIEAITVVRTGPTVTTRAGVPVFVPTASVDPAFFDIFALPFVHGSAATALPDTNAIVLTETEARRQFGRTDVLGRTMSLGAGEGKRDRRVTGVLRDLPKNSNLKLNLLFRNDQSQFAKWPASEIGWGAMSQQHYVKLRAGADVAAINAAFPAWERRVIAPQNIGGTMLSQADILDLKLVPITDVHLGDAQQGALTPGGDARTLTTFGIVAVLILGMAVMNFVNLSTARATQRAREIAVRKVLGASRRQIVVQMLGESLLMTALAMLLACTIFELATPWVAAWTGADLHVAYGGASGMLLPALALFALTGLAGGLYPAILLSRFRPASVLRANRASAETVGSGRLRIALVVFQFAIAIGLIASTWVIWSQTRFIAATDPGYRRDGLIQIDQAWRFAGSDRYEPARTQLLAIPGVVAAGRTNLALAATNKSIVSVRAPGGSGLNFGRYAIDKDFFATMGMRLLAGRALGDRFASDRIVRNADDYDDPVDPARGINVVVNRAAARLLGHADLNSAVGLSVQVGIDGGLVPARIAGVIEDTRVRTPRDAIEPIVYTYDPLRTSQVIVRYAAARPAEVMAGVAAVWRRFEPEIPFEGRFAEDIVAETYSAERARGALFATFAALAIMIACLGLYGLAAFATQRRTKEIGIRKVLGAKVRDIVRLLAWQFSKPVVLANLVAWPAAWWAMRDWLDTFDVRIALTPTPFALAGVLALVIALATVAGHALRVARLNPIHALRYE
jgi:putative ABC transport system permease protein